MINHCSSLPPRILTVVMFQSDTWILIYEGCCCYQSSQQGVEIDLE